MKMNFKSMMIAAVAMTTMMASCSKEDGGSPESGEAKSVFLKITREEAPAGRAAGKHVGAVAVTMNDGYVYFATSGGDIMTHVEIDFGNPTDGYASNKVGSTTLENGAEITSVPGSVTQVVIVGNLPGGTYPTTGNISQFNTASYITVESQYDATGKGVAKVTLFGKNTLTKESGENKYSSEVEIEPIAARIEIGNIAGDYTDGSVTSTIKSFTLEGIYINRYYTSMGIDGVAKSAVTNNLSDETKYNAAAAGSAYSSFNGILADYTPANLVAQSVAPIKKYGPVASATDADVWGYNLLAPTGGAMPSIVIRVKDVVTNDGSNDDAASYAGTKYLTVRNIYVDNSTSPLSSLLKGYVYRIKDFKFAESHLTVNPEQNSIDITVEAVLMSWEPKDVDYDFD